MAQIGSYLITMRLLFFKLSKYVIKKIYHRIMMRLNFQKVVLSVSKLARCCVFWAHI